MGKSGWRLMLEILDAGCSFFDVCKSPNNQVISQLDTLKEISKIKTKIEQQKSKIEQQKSKIE